VVQARGRGGIVGGEREEGKGAGADGGEEDAALAEGARIDAGEVGGKEGGKPTEGAGRVMAVGGAEDEGVVGAAIGARRPEQGTQHGSSLWTEARASNGGAGAGGGAETTGDRESVGC